MIKTINNKHMNKLTYVIIIMYSGRTEQFTACIYISKRYEVLDASYQTTTNREEAFVSLLQLIQINNDLTVSETKSRQA